MSDRDTGDLFTAMHSVSAREVQAKRRALKEENQAKRIELRKNDETILSMIDEARNKMPERLWHLVTPSMSKEEMEATKLALQLFDKELYSFRNKISIALGKQPIDYKEIAS